jgi:hypothetical protein
LALAPACNCGGGNPDGGTGGGSSAGGGTSGTGGGTGGTGGSSGGGTAGTGGGASGFDAGLSVVEHHNGPMRTGLYVDARLTKAAVANLHQDTGFNPAVDGPVYAQPLFLDSALHGQDVLIVATEQNIVSAIAADGGTALWKTQPLAPPVSLGDLPCGNINPLGITGTPFVDLKRRVIYLDAMTTPDNGTTKKHLVYALSLDTGVPLTGWPVDIEAALAGHNPTFHSEFQNQRGALTLLGNILYVPFGGHYGDCGTYYGWVIGIDVTQPTSVTAFNTDAQGGGIWNVGGVLADATHLYVATGNTFGASTWGGGDGVYRFTPGPTWSGMSPDYWAPANWMDLDTNDLDMGTALPLDAPSPLIAAFGKDGKAYLVDRNNLGGIGAELTSMQMGNGELNGAATAYTTSAGTFLAVRLDGNGTGVSCSNNGTGNFVAMTITAGPTLNAAWCGTVTGLSVPISSMSAPGQDAIVWTISSDSLFAYDGETGAVIASPNGIGAHSYFQTPLIAKGRVYVAGHNQLFAFTP